MNRTVRALVPSLATYEGDGFLVHRPFPTRSLAQVDPFLLLDEMGPLDVPPGAAKGASDHPHRGFEIVTYLLAGGLQHRDSHGHAGSIDPGDAQYMLAGDGVVHSEQPAATIVRDGGTVHGVQLWINLPRDQKRLRPRYQDVRAKDVPVVEFGAGSRVRVVAGRGFGVASPLQTRHPVDYYHFTLAPGAVLDVPLVAATAALAYVLAATVTIAGRAVERGTLAILSEAGEAVALENRTAEAVEMLLLASAPIGEPIVRYGPFVMNTRAEIEQAFADYQAGRFGEIARIN